MKEYIELLKKIISTPSVSGNEKAVADILQTFIEGKGFETKRKFNNIWVENEPASEKPTILLNAHLDTVKPVPSYSRDPYAAEEENGVLYGLGSNDCGGCIVALLAAFFKLSESKQSYRLIYSATAGEENCAPDGIESVIAELGKIDLGIIGEPTGMRMAVAEKGLLVLDCKAKGKGGHAARNEGVNAIYEALKDIEWFRNYRFDKVSEYLGPMKMTVTIINAGTQHNVIPDQCNFTVDVRANGEYTNREILDIIRSNVSCEVTPRSMKHNSSSISKSHPAVIKGLQKGFVAFGSPTTSNQTRCCFPTIKIGPGESERSHSADEYILVSEIENGYQKYVELLNGLTL